MMEFTFEISPWEQELENCNPGDTLSALRLLSLLESEDEEVTLEALVYCTMLASANDAAMNIAGVIAGGPVRAVMECAGISDVLTKSMGSPTAINMVRAVVDALKQLEEPEEIAARRGLSLEEVAPDALLRARAAGIAEARKAREEAAAEAKDGE